MSRKAFSCRGLQAATLPSRRGRYFCTKVLNHVIARLRGSAGAEATQTPHLTYGFLHYVRNDCIEEEAMTLTPPTHHHDETVK